LVVISLRDVSFEYPGHIRALENVNLDLRDGERVALIGPNGAGKSTLLHLMSALDFGKEGEVTIAGS